MKFKPKLLLKRAVALLTATALSFSLATQALAESFFMGLNSGTTAALGDPSAMMYGTNERNSWKVSLYVATTDDGKIDPATANIATGTGLARIGTIIYDNDPHNASDAVYYPLTTSDDKRYTAESKFQKTGSAAPSFPYVAQVRQNAVQIPGSEMLSSNTNSAAGTMGDPIYHKDGSIMATWLPTTGAYYDTANNSKEFAQTVIEQMNNALGGTSDNFYPLYAKVLGAGACKLGTAAGDKLDTAIDDKGDDGYKVLLPTSNDCVVQWACVIEPLVERRTNSDGAFFEFHYIDEGIYFGMKTAVQTSSAAHQYMLLDAYGTAQYNEASRKLYNPDLDLFSQDADLGHLDVIRRKTTIIDLTTKSHSSRSCVDSWADKGQLQSEYGSLLANSATSCYDTHAGYTYYCGVPVAGALGSSLNYGSVEFTNLSAQYGGIAVLISELKEGIPVYYYIYDDKNNFTGEIITDSYTPDDTGFIPKQDYGIPIADESISSTDQPLVSTTGKQMYFYYNDYASTRANLVDFKGTSAESEWINPKAITEPIKTRVDVAYRVTKEAKSIHVKSIKPPSVDIVYHIYTYSAEDESYDTLSALTGTDLVEAVKDMTPKVSTSKRSIALTPTQTSYQASTDTNARVLGTPIHVTAAAIGKETTSDHCPDGCAPGNKGLIKRTTAYKTSTETIYQVAPTVSVPFNDEATGTGTRQIHVKIINVKKAPTLG